MQSTGIDSAESARQMMIDRAACWLESAGLTILKKDEIKAKLDQIPPIKTKDEIYLE